MICHKEDSTLVMVRTAVNADVDVDISILPSADADIKPDIRVNLDSDILLSHHDTRRLIKNRVPINYLLVSIFRNKLLNFYLGECR